MSDGGAGAGRTRRDVVRPGSRRARGRPAIRRPAYAHLEHPTRDGVTLCGEDPLRLETCPSCAARYAHLCLVHVQSARKPDRTFCGLPVPAMARPRSWGATAEHAGVASPFYVSSQDAMGLMDLMRRVPDLARGVPFCPGCTVNLRRANRAIGHESTVQSSSGDFGVVAHRRPASRTGTPSVVDPVDGPVDGLDEEGDRDE